MNQIGIIHNDIKSDNVLYNKKLKDYVSLIGE